MYQAHYSCSALSTKHTSIAQHYYYFAQHSTQRTLRMLSIEHSMPLQRCLLSFAQASYTQVCSIKELGSVHSKSMFCRHTVLQPGPIACHIGYILKVHIIVYTVQCKLYSVHPQSTSTPGSMAGIIAAEGASPSKHTSEQPVFMHQVQCHEKLCINKCFFVI